MANTTLGAAVIGCGNIANKYGKHIASYDNLTITGAFDLDIDRAKAFAGEFGGTVYASLEDALADDTVDIVVNLTIHHAHYDVISQCLEAGKHVHTEKPIALRYAEASELVELADRKNLRLSSAPITYMGETVQTAWKQIREGKCGEVRLIYAEINHGKIEAWHPNPEPFYDVGVMFDVGVYPLTNITTMFGPVRRVTCHSAMLQPERIKKDGSTFTPGKPTYYLAFLELEAGPVVRLSANFYVAASKQGGAIEFHGDEGSLVVKDFQSFGAGVEYCALGTPGKKFSEVPLLREPFEGIEFGRGIQDLADAILHDRPHRATGAQAAHVVEVIEAMFKSGDSGLAVEVTSSFPSPSPMDWAQG